MGRTYKRNDTYQSNRAKSLREKRNKQNEPLSKKNYQHRNKQTDRYESPEDFIDE